MNFNFKFLQYKYILLYLVVVNIIFFLIGWWQITINLIYDDLYNAGAKYTIENTTIFLINGILIFILIYYYFKYVVKEYNFKFNSSFVMFIITISAMGGILRAINDKYKVSILLITPFIYILIFIYFIIFVSLIVRYSKYKDKKDEYYFIQFLAVSIITLMFDMLLLHICFSDLTLSMVLLITSFMMFISLLNLKFYDRLFIISFFGALFDSSISVYAVSNGYYEKQLLSSFFMNNSFLFIIYKIFLVSVLFYLMKEYDKNENRVIFKLMALGIFILNYAPFIRDLIRVINLI